MTPLQWLMVATGIGCILWLHRDMHKDELKLRRPWQPLGWRELQEWKKRRERKEEGAK